MNDAAGLFRLLGDDARLRLLRLLSLESLNVTELTGIVGLAQSGVSRHLGLLKDAGLVAEERQGGFSYYRVSPSLRGGANGWAGLWSVLESQFEVAATTPAGRADAARLEEIRRLRKENFDEHSGPGERGQVIPGRSWAAWARALGHLLPAIDVADLGCGEGYLTIEAARFARRVIALDHSDGVLERARDMARRHGITNIQWKRGDIEYVPLRDACVDLALLSQALHHATAPEIAVAEAVRILRPGGRVLVLDLRRHDEQWVTSAFGDRRLGFDDEELKGLLRESGLAHVKVTVGAHRPRDPFTVLIASGLKKPDAAHSRKDRRDVR
jgi:SAM-dependent methyltransferase